jgi:hypothetical protein
LSGFRLWRNPATGGDRHVWVVRLRFNPKNSIESIRRLSWADFIVVCRFIGGFQKSPIPPSDGTRKSGNYEELEITTTFFGFKMDSRWSLSRNLMRDGNDVLFLRRLPSNTMPRDLIEKSAATILQG